MIKKEGPTFIVLSPTGTIIGTFGSEKAAQQYESELLLRKQKEKQKKPE